MGRPSKKKNELLNKELEWFDINNYAKGYENNIQTNSALLNQIIGRVSLSRLLLDALFRVHASLLTTAEIQQFLNKYPTETDYLKFVEITTNGVVSDIPSRCLSLWRDLTLNKTAFKAVMDGEVTSTSFNFLSTEEKDGGNFRRPRPPYWSATLFSGHGSGRPSGLFIPTFYEYETSNCNAASPSDQPSDSIMIEVCLNAPNSVIITEIESIIDALRTASHLKKSNRQHVKEALSFRGDHTLAVIDLLIWENIFNLRIPDKKIADLLSNTHFHFGESEVTERVIPRALRAMDLNYLGVVSNALSQNEGENKGV